jgi:hypothetical protein
MGIPVEEARVVISLTACECVLAAFELVLSARRK